MKVESRERVEKSVYNVYIANDGTEFRDREQCEKYDESAEGVIMHKVADCLVNDLCGEDFFGLGSCDCTIWVLKPKTQDDIDAILQAWLLANPHMAQEAKYYEQMSAAVHRAVAEDDFLLIERGYEMSGFWLMGTRNSMKEDFDKLCSPVEKKEE